MLGIVVVSYGSVDLLRTNLGRLGLGQTGAHVVVVDNLRTPDAQAAVRDLAAERHWDFVASASNRGFGAGMNVGVDTALARGCTELLLVNPDLAIDPDVVAALAEQVRRTPRTLVTPRIVRPDGRAWFTGGRLDLHAGWTRNVDDDGTPRTDGWLTAACLAVHADLWRELRGFDEDYFLYWEDVDLSHRCSSAGGQLMVRRDLTVVHDVGGTQAASGAAKSRAYYRYNTRNRLLFAAKHLHRRDALRWVLSSPGYARAVLLRGGRRQLLRPWGPVSAVVHGTAAGAWHVVRAAASRS